MTVMNYTEQIRIYAIEELKLKEQMLLTKANYKHKSKVVFVHNIAKHRFCIKLNETDQDIFSRYKSELIHAVPNQWGKHGWTLFYYETLPPELIKDALDCSLAFVKTQK
jgi:hypothetical protein